MIHFMRSAIIIAICSLRKRSSNIKLYNSDQIEIIYTNLVDRRVFVEQPMRHTTVSLSYIKY